MEKEILLISANVNENNKDDYSQLSTICSIYSGLDVITSQNFDGMINRYQNIILLISKIKLLVMDITEESIEQGIILNEACNRNIPTFIISKQDTKIPSILEDLKNIYGIYKYDNKPIETAQNIANFVRQYQVINTYKK